MPGRPIRPSWSGVTIVVLIGAAGDPRSADQPARSELSQDLLNRLKPPAWLPGGSPAYLLGTDADRPRPALADPLGQPDLARDRAPERAPRRPDRGGQRPPGGLCAAAGSTLVIGRLADIQQAIPLLILALAVIAVVGSSILNLVLVLGVGSWLYYFRVVRGEVLSVRRAAVHRRRPSGGDRRPADPAPPRPAERRRARSS